MHVDSIEYSCTLKCTFSVKLYIINMLYNCTENMHFNVHEYYLILNVDLNAWKLVLKIMRLSSYEHF